MSNPINVTSGQNYIHGLNQCQVEKNLPWMDANEGEWDYLNQPAMGRPPSPAGFGLGGDQAHQPD